MDVSLGSHAHPTANSGETGRPDGKRRSSDVGVRSAKTLVCASRPRIKMCVTTAIGTSTIIRSTAWAQPRGAGTRHGCDPPGAPCAVGPEPVSCPHDTPLVREQANNVSTLACRLTPRQSSSAPGIPPHTRRLEHARAHAGRRRRTRWPPGRISSLLRLRCHHHQTDPAASIHARH